jgi:hypothetical protein
MIHGLGIVTSNGYQRLPMLEIASLAVKAELMMLMHREISVEKEQKDVLKGTVSTDF